MKTQNKQITMDMFKILIFHFESISFKKFLTAALVFKENYKKKYAETHLGNHYLSHFWKFSPVLPVIAAHDAGNQNLERAGMHYISF